MAEPGVTSEVLRPEEAFDRFLKVKSEIQQS